MIYTKSIEKSQFFNQLVNN